MEHGFVLLGGDTVVPSGLYARLCHAFLVLFYFTCEQSYNVFYFLKVLDRSLSNFQDWWGINYIGLSESWPAQYVFWFCLHSRQWHIPNMSCFWTSRCTWDCTFYPARCFVGHKKAEILQLSHSIDLQNSAKVRAPTVAKYDKQATVVVCCW